MIYSVLVPFYAPFNRLRAISHKTKSVGLQSILLLILQKLYITFIFLLLKLI